VAREATGNDRALVARSHRRRAAARTERRSGKGASTTGSHLRRRRGPRLGRVRRCETPSAVPALRGASNRGERALLLTDFPELNEGKLRAAVEAERLVQGDRSLVPAVDVQEGNLTRAEHSIDHVSEQRPRESASLGLRIRANAADLPVIADPHALAGHREQPPLAANAYEGAELNRALAEGPRMRQRDQRQHVCDIGRAER
jgi:hypothetical protein